MTDNPIVRSDEKDVVVDVTVQEVQAVDKQHVVYHRLTGAMRESLVSSSLVLSSLLLTYLQCQ